MSALAKSGSEAAQWLGYQWPGTPIKCVMVEVLDQKNSKTKPQKIVGVKKCQVAYLLILEGNKRFHYTISGVECNKRFTRTLQCAKRFFRLFGENLVSETW